VCRDPVKEKSVLRSNSRREQQAAAAAWTVSMGLSEDNFHGNAAITLGRWEGGLGLLWILKSDTVLP